jgi:hypothetical protein
MRRGRCQNGEQTQDLVQYLRAHRNYVSANLGWASLARLAVVWLAGMCIPLAVKTWVPVVGLEAGRGGSYRARSAYLVSAEAVNE